MPSVEGLVVSSAEVSFSVSCEVVSSVEGCVASSFFSSDGVVTSSPEGSVVSSLEGCVTSSFGVSLFSFVGATVLS